MLDIWPTGSDQRAVSGISASLTYLITRSWEVFITTRFSQRITHSDSQLDARLSLWRFPVVAGGRFLHWLGRWGVGGQLSVACEIQRLHLSTDGSVEQSADQHDVHVAVAATLLLAVRLITRLRLQLEIGAELGLNNKRYIITNSNNVDVALGRPAAVRPRLGLSLMVILF